MSRKYLFLHLPTYYTYSFCVYFIMDGILNWCGTDDHHSQSQFNFDSRFQFWNLSELLVWSFCIVAKHFGLGWFFCGRIPVSQFLVAEFVEGGFNFPIIIFVELMWADSMVEFWSQLNGHQIRARVFSKVSIIIYVAVLNWGPFWCINSGG
jgi:hypothetical protein